MFKELEILKKNFQIFESIRKQTEAIEQIKANIPQISFYKQINAVKKIHSLPACKLAFDNHHKLYDIFENQGLAKIHKTSFSYLNFHKNIVKSFPNFAELSELNNNIQNLNLNRPYLALKGTLEWESYQQLKHTFDMFAPLIDTINKYSDLNRIMINEISIQEWLETLKTNKEIILSFNAFKDSDLGTEISSELKLNSKEYVPSIQERQILFLIFIGFIISFQYPDLGSKLLTNAGYTLEEISKNASFVKFSTLVTLISIPSMFMKFVTNSKSIATDFSSYLK
jgi:hypothetical protein